MGWRSLELHVKPHPSSAARWEHTRRAVIFMMALAIVASICGCGPKRVRADFTHYENSYAVTSNREELLNLARLEQHDPTYFFKLGQISSSYRMEASLSAAGNLSTVGSPPATAIPTGGGTPGFVYENDPSFTFIPVNDDTNAEILLKPVSAEVFYSLYLQGWRLDQLLRLTVDRIELTLPVPNGNGCQVVVIRNSPPPDFDAAGDYPNDKYNLASYITSLRVSAVIYALQKHGFLLLRGTSNFEPLDQASYIANETGGGDEKNGGDKTGAEAASAGTAENPAAAVTNAPGNVTIIVGNPSATQEKAGAAAARAGAASSGTQGSTTAAGSNAPGNVTFVVGNPAGAGGGGNASKNPAAPTAKEFDEVAAKDQVWELQPNANGKGSRWVLGAKSLEPQFQLTIHTGAQPLDGGYYSEKSYGQNVETIKEALEKDFAQDSNGMKELTSGADLTEILEILYNGFSIEESSSDQDAERNLCSGTTSNRISAHLVMRSLIGLMAAAAQEQDSFDAMMDKPHTVPDEFGDNVMAFYSAVHLATTGVAPSTQELADKQKLLKPNAVVSDVIPKIEQLPVLKLTWPDSALGSAQNSRNDLATLGLAVRYKGQNFMITDLKPDSSSGSAFSQNMYWNRDMFRLISELSSQVSVDISKFPLPEVLQLRTE
jgi:hypothetical protein